jgi:DNA-binding beta-propeller fold protein YncE
MIRKTPLLILVLAACGSNKPAPAPMPAPAPAPPPVVAAAPPDAAPPPAPTPDAAPAAPAPEPPPPPPPDPALAMGYTTSTIALPGGNADGVFMDYLAYDARTKAVWVPAGNSGAVDVIDVASGKLDQVPGFATQEMERRGRKRIVGPSSVTLGEKGTVYVGNRGDSTVCAIDEKKLTKGTCGTLDSMPDGIAYVAKTKELWVTTPRDQSVRILDGKTLAQKEKLSFEGDPEGFAVDNKRGRFYTNLEDKDKTLAIDLKSHKTVATWEPSCGEEGPHGLRLDEAKGFLFIACSAKAEAMDVAHDGKLLGSVDTGDGVDDLDYDVAAHRLYVGAARAATLTIANVDAKGAIASYAVIATAQGARNGVAAGGTIYLAHSAGSELVVASPPAKPEKPAKPAK